MNRREYVMGLLGFTTAGVGGYVLSQQNRQQNVIKPQQVDILDAEGTTTMSIPTPTGITLVDFFATYCSGCEKQITALEPIHDDADDVSIVSLTTQTIGEGFSRSDLRAWWENNGGAWTVGIDGGTLASAIGVRTLPTVTILDSNGTVHWAGSQATTSQIETQLASAKNTDTG